MGLSGRGGANYSWFLVCIGNQISMNHKWSFPLFASLDKIIYVNTREPYWLNKAKRKWNIYCDEES